MSDISKSIKQVINILQLTKVVFDGLHMHLLCFKRRHYKTIANIFKILEVVAACVGSFLCVVVVVVKTAYTNMFWFHLRYN